MKKKILSLLVMLCVITTFVPCIYAATIIYNGTCGKDGDNLTWTLDSNGLLTISGEGDMNNWGAAAAPWYKQSENINTVKITEGVTSIGSYAFYYCKNIEDIIVLSNDLHSIGKAAFNGTAWYKNQPDGLVYIGDWLYEYKSGWKLELTEISITDGTVGIADSAFESSSKLISISIPDSVKYIGNTAFFACTQLKDIKIPSGVTSINNGTFHGCAFDSIDIPKNVVSIGTTAFYRCKNLTDINVSSENQYYCSIDGVLFDKEKTKLIKYPDNKNSISYTIPNSVAIIEDYAFSHNSYIADIIMPDSINIINNAAFESCVNLNNIIVPNGLISIDGNAFDYTGYYNDESNWIDDILYIDNYLISTRSYSENLAINAGTRHIARNAFYGKSINSITIPTSVTCIEDNNFYYTALTDVYYLGTKEQWDNMKIGINNDDLFSATIHFALQKQCFAVSNSVVTNLSDTEETATVIIADYMDDILHDINIRTVTFQPKESKEFEYGIGNKHKIFVWNSITGMYPLRDVRSQTSTK